MSDVLLDMREREAAARDGDAVPELAELVRLLREMPIPMHLGGGVCYQAADWLERQDILTKTLRLKSAMNEARAEAAEAECAALRKRLEVSDEHPYDGIACRDETIRLLDQKVAALLADAERYRWMARAMSPAELVQRLRDISRGTRNINDKVSRRDAAAILDELAKAEECTNISVDATTELKEAHARADKAEAECAALRADAERFAFWFSPASKTIDINEYLRGVRFNWTLDQWRSYIDSARAALAKDAP